MPRNRIPRPGSPVMQPPIEKHPKRIRAGVPPKINGSLLAPHRRAVRVTRDGTRAGLLAAQRRVLQHIARGAPLAETLELLVHLIEDQAGGLRCAVLMAEPGGKRLRFMAAPSIPADYKFGIEPYLVVAPDMGSCGTAAFLREPVYTRDTATDLRWKNCSGIAVRNGLRAIWSTPVLADNGKVLGTFAMYYSEPRLPSLEQVQLIDMATQMARVAFERHHDGARLQTVRKRLRGLIARARRSGGAAAARREHLEESLSAQEKRVLALVAEGKTNREIADALGLSGKTVKNYLSTIFQKLQVGRRTQAAVIYRQGA